MMIASLKHPPLHILIYTINIQFLARIYTCLDFSQSCALYIVYTKETLYHKYFYFSFNFLVQPVQVLKTKKEQYPLKRLYKKISSKSCYILTKKNFFWTVYTCKTNQEKILKNNRLYTVYCIIWKLGHDACIKKEE